MLFRTFNINTTDNIVFCEGIGTIPGIFCPNGSVDKNLPKRGS